MKPKMKAIPASKPVHRKVAAIKKKPAVKKHAPRKKVAVKKPVPTKAALPKKKPLPKKQVPEKKPVGKAATRKVITKRKVVTNKPATQKAPMKKIVVTKPMLQKTAQAATEWVGTSAMKAIPCPDCGAKAGEMCISKEANMPVWESHPARIVAYTTSRLTSKLPLMKQPIIGVR